MGATKILFDLRATEYLDSTGLAFFVQTYETLRDIGAMAIIRRPEQHRILDTVCLAERLNVKSSETTALDALHTA